MVARADADDDALFKLVYALTDDAKPRQALGLSLLAAFAVSYARSVDG